MRVKHLRPIRLAVVAAVIACGALGFLPGAAWAGGPALKLSPPKGPPTALVKVIGSGFTPSRGDTLSFDGNVVAVVNASSAGTFTVPLHVPSDAVPGPHTFSAEDFSGKHADATFTVQINWPLPAFAVTHNSFDPYENVLSPSDARSLSEVAKLTFLGPIKSEPIYVGGGILVGTGDSVEDIDANSHNVLWTFTAQAPVVGSPSFLSTPCNVVLVESQDGSIDGLNPANGMKLWSYAAGTPLSGSPVGMLPLVQHGEEAIAVADDGSVYALNACTGALFWSHVASETPTQPVTPAILTSALTSDGTRHTIIVVCAGPTVNAFDATTGTQLWSARERHAIDASPAVYGSGTSARVMIGEGPNVVELNGGTGALVWTRPTEGVVAGIGLYSTTGTTSSGALTTSLKSVIAGDGRGDLYSLKPSTGAVNWGTHGLGPVDGAPAIANGVVYLATASSPSAPAALVALNAATGHGILNSDELNPQPYPPGPPSIADGKVLVGDFDSNLAIFALPR